MRNRERWLKQRQKGIGSSDAPVVMGVSTRKTPYELQQEKLSEDLIQEKEKNIMKTGLALERGILQLYREREDVTLMRQGGGIRRSHKLDFMFFTPDAIAIKDGRMRVVEAKAAFFPEKGEWGEEYTDFVPAPYLLQCMHDLSCVEHLDIETVDLPVLMYGYIRIYRIKRDEELIKILEQKEQEFWEHHIIERAPIPPDFANPNIQRIINARVPAPGATVVIEDPEAACIIRNYQHAETNLKAMDAYAKALKAQLIDMMGEATEALFPEGFSIRRTLVNRSAYEVKASSYCRTTIISPKEEKV